MSISFQFQGHQNTLFRSLPSCPLGLTAVCVKFLRIHVKIVHILGQIPFFFLEFKSEKWIWKELLLKSSYVMWWFSYQVVSDSLQPRLPASWHPWDFPDKNTGMGCHFLLQGVFPIQGLNMGLAKSWTQLSDFPFTFHFHVLEKEMATHSSVLAWRIPGMGEPGGLPSMGSHRVRQDWSDLAAAAAPALLVDSLPTELPGRPLCNM